MIEMETAARQIDRLTGMNFYPPNAAAVKELVLAVMSAETDSIAFAAISCCVERMDRCPMPAEIRRIVWEMNEQLPKAARNCQLCGGTTFITSYWLITHEFGYKRRERLPFTDPGSYTDFCRERQANPLPQGSPRQEFLIGSEPCSCKPVRLEEEPKPRKSSRSMVNG